MPPKKNEKKKEAVLDPEVGSLCLFNHEEHAWSYGKVISWDGKTAVCKAHENTNPLFTWETGEQLAKLSAEDVFCCNQEVLDENVLDLLSLTVLHDSTLLNVLRKRYFSDYIYTNIGAITVALNPFNFKIPWYTDDNMGKYLAEGDRIEENIPHSWATAHNTFWEMRNATHDPVNQCILVSGESGAGKTEASKIVMKYLAALSCKSGSDAQKQAAVAVGSNINITSAPLEAFGNARTARNDNSSRFGKWMKVQFDDSGFLVGAHITKYLLEKSRIVTASPGERVYHSFYCLCRASDKAKWDILSDTDYRSTSAGKQSANKEFDTAEEFVEINTNLQTLGVSVETIESIWKVVAGVLNLENADFEASGEGSQIGKNSQQWVDKTVKAWSIDGAVFTKELITTTLDTRDGPVETLLNPMKARDGRSALTKTLYDHQFSWIIETCNNTLNVEGDGRWIGLLDIFGFEDFEINSFEQLCINLANESLQNHYNKYIFEKDMDECRTEGIDVTAVEFPDNGPCLRMITGKGGIFAMLDEECALGTGSDESFLSKTVDACSGDAYKEFFTKKTLAKASFIIHHYAGSVSYEIANFLDKNRDTLKIAFVNLMRASSDALICTLLPPAQSKKMTVGGFFKSQVADLMDLINSTNPHWIRCVKPHPAKKPLSFHGVKTMQQLASSGVLGTVKIRKAGFPVRIQFEHFVEAYSIIGTTGTEAKDRCQAIINNSGLDPKTAQIGKARVFLKSDSYVELEKLKKIKLELHNVVFLAHCRAYLAIIGLKQVVYDANKAAVDQMREEVRREVRAKYESERAEREAREAEEREALAAIADGLANIGRDADTAGNNIVEQEHREWTKLMEDFENMFAVIEEMVSEREEREEQEKIEREEEAQRLLDDAATQIQRTLRGWLCRTKLLRQLTERARAQTEYDVDSRIFRQHMVMLALDTQRVLMEDDFAQSANRRNAADEREAQWKANEARRQAQVKAVEERKMEKFLMQQQMEDEVTEHALIEAHRLRVQRQEVERHKKIRKAQENIGKKAIAAALQAEAFEARELKARETESYQLRRQRDFAVTQESFNEAVEQSRTQRTRVLQDSAAYKNGQHQYATMEAEEQAARRLPSPPLVLNEILKSPQYSTPSRQ